MQNARTIVVTGAFSSRLWAFYAAIGFINSLAQEYPRILQLIIELDDKVTVAARI